MRVHIGSKEFDIAANMAIERLVDSQQENVTRRVTRTATLDGAVTVTDRGFSDGDRTLVLTYDPISEAHDDIAKRIISLHSRVTICMMDGAFEAAPQSFLKINNRNQFTFLVIEKLSE